MIKRTLRVLKWRGDTSRKNSVEIGVMVRCAEKGRKGIAQ